MLMIAAFGLFNLTVLQGAENDAKSTSRKTRTITLQAQRGKILDSSGLPLAYDRRSYNVTFSRDPYQTGESWRAKYTDIIIKTIDIVEKNGSSVVDSFVIRKDENGEFYFYWGVTDEEAVKARDKLWRSNMSIPEDATAYEAYNTLRQRYMIPDDMTYEEAFKVLSIWQEVQNMAFKAYIPVVIAYDVDSSTVAEIAQQSNELIGMDIEESSVRVYPHNESAAHIVGYLSKAYDEEKLADMQSKGYSSDDTVGASGIEQTMEEQLSSAIGTRVGKRVVEIDSSGKIIQEISREEPTQGNDVVLTIDYELQKKLEDALKSNIESINAKQKEIYNANLAEYKQKEADRGGKETKFAETGAAIVMDVNTGKVLALANYPSYDPNKFIGGISEEEYAVYRDDERAPMFNKAISSRAEPGSIFKMVTAYAGLSEGAITPSTRISCEDEYSKIVTQGRAPGCWTDYPSQHANQDVIAGLKNSCNYFFYEVSNRLGIDKLNKWSDTFGLSSRTNIELPGEVTSHVANQKVLFDNEADLLTGQSTYKGYLVKELIKKQLAGYGTLRGKTYTDEQLESAATQIVMLVGEDSDKIGPGIREILRKELDIPESITYARRWDSQINSSLYEITWNPVQTVLTGIGQSVTSVTPIAVARYISAIANGGTVYEASIVQRVVDPNGNVVEENDPQVFSTLNDTNGYLDLIIEGMREVVSPEDGGTAASAMRNFKYKDNIAAKTGTAQVSKIDIENTSWFVAFTPLEKPEIAVVVYIPNGMSGANGSQTAIDIIEFYLDRKAMQTTENMTQPGELTP